MIDMDFRNPANLNECYLKIMVLNSSGLQSGDLGKGLRNWALAQKRKRNKKRFENFGLKPGCVGSPFLSPD
jgi:hypothetical protein